jgi:tetratricopeptide (TPR) repeat protein
LFLLLLYASAYRSFVAGQWWLLWARINGDNKELLDRAVAADPQGFLPWLAQGDAARALGQTDEALAYYAAASERAPRNVYAHARQLEGLLAQGDRTGAEAQLQAIRDVDWDNNLLYQWAWQHLSVAPPPRLDMDGASDIGSINGFYRAERDGDASYRWTMGTARLRFASADGQPISKLRLRLRADEPNSSVAVFASDKLMGLREIGRLQVGTAWQQFEVPLGANTLIALDVELRSPAPIRSPQQPYPRGVAVDWVEVN